MSVFSMLANAGLMVKLVMLALIVFSVISWAIIITKQLLYVRVRKASDLFIEEFWNSTTLAEAYEAATSSQLSPEAAVFVSGYNEMQKILSARGEQGKNSGLDMRLATMDNLKRAVRKAQLLETERLGRSLSFLATTGSATPFIGLFGTVWGIMTSFQDIGQRGSASLAVVAPGISEALVATAAGLAVAIPAVIFYNYFSNRLADMEAEMENFSTDFLNLIERDIMARKA